MNQINNLENVGEYNGWQIYRNSDGFLEGFKSIGKDKDDPKDLKRVITNQKTLQGFIDYLNGLRPPKKTIKDIPLKPSDLPQLFEEK